MIEIFFSNLVRIPRRFVEIMHFPIKENTGVRLLFIATEIGLEFNSNEYWRNLWDIK